MSQLKGKDPKHTARVNDAAFKVGTTTQVVEEVLDLLCQYKTEKINKIELPKDRVLSKEEFEEAMPIFKIPHIGYLKPNYYKYSAINNKKFKKKQDGLDITTGE